MSEAIIKRLTLLHSQEALVLIYSNVAIFAALGV